MTTTTNYFGFAISGSMFTSSCELSMEFKTPEQAREMLRDWSLEGSLSPCLNPSHTATIKAMESRFGISVEIPTVAPRCNLKSGDSLLLLQVAGLPRLDATRHEYTDEEISKATFTFQYWKVK